MISLSLRSLSRRSVPLLLLAGATALPAAAQVPRYEVRSVAPFSVTTSLRNASGAGHLVGYQIPGGNPIAFVATEATGIQLLPLPPGYASSTALDVNRDGVVVGAAAVGGFPFDGGEPAVWLPDGSGGYTVHVPQQFATLPSPLGPLAVNGGMIVGVNDQGTLVGWSRYQGFQGGPTTLFSLNGPPVDLRALGFQATVLDLAEDDLICGGSLRMDLTTGVVTDLGVPPPVGGVGFNGSFAYGVNRHGRCVVAARRATSTADRWVTYLQDDANGWRPLNPTALPTPNVGFYDLNDRGDVSATGGVWFEAEGALLPGFDGLLEPGSAHWDTSLGFVDVDRRVATTAIDTLTGVAHLVLLVPVEIGTRICDPAPVNSSGLPGDLRVEGSDHLASEDLTLVAEQLPPGVFGYFLNSLTAGPGVQPAGSQGLLCLSGGIGRYVAAIQDSGPNGRFELALDPALTPTPSGTVAMQFGETWVFQAWYRDQNPGATSNFTNAVSVSFD